MKDNTSVFAKFDKAELKVITDNIKAFYEGREDRPSIPGAIVNFVCQSLPEALTEYKRLTEAGYTLREDLTSSWAGNMGQVYYLFMLKPAKEQAADLKPLFAKAEEEYRADIEAFNNEVVERQVQLMVAQAEKKRGQARAQEELDEVARIRAMVISELGAPV